MEERNHLAPLNKLLYQKHFFFVLCFLVISILGAFCLRGDTAEELPKWVERLEYSLQLESGKKPTFYFQTVQPLYQSDDKLHTYYIQPRVSIYNERTTSNLGFGYRRLTSENLILGINVFADYQDLNRHGRAGAGFEALGQVLELRLNSYFGGITPKRTVEQSGNATTIEKVADGIDYELGAPLPYLPWLKLYGSGFWYDFENFGDKVGWKSRLEATLNKYVKAEFYTWDDNKGEQEFGGRLRFNIAFNTFGDILKTFHFSEESFPHKDLSEQLLIPVERDFNITVEKHTESGGFVVEAGRL